MEIIVGKLSGFCFGVNNAVSEAEKLVEAEKEIYCLGELVHNRQVIDKLEKKGLKIIENIEQAPNNCKLIIRAHGIAPEIYERAKEKNIEVFDYTCPTVKKLHKTIDKAKKDNYIFLIGEKNHPEIIGSKGFAGKNCCIIQDESDINNAIQEFKNSKMEKLYIAAQTTASVSKFNAYVETILEKLPNTEIEINKSICDSTRLRQEEVSKISKKVDYMVIIGGKNSSNTTKLYNIAKENCESIHIQTKDELNINEIKKYNKIGISAGASTPKESIEEVEKILKSIN